MSVPTCKACAAEQALPYVEIVPHDCPDRRRELYEERAAILEFCAGYPRAEAERLARLAHPDPDAPGPKQAEMFQPVRGGRIPT